MGRGLGKGRGCWGGSLGFLASSLWLRGNLRNPGLVTSSSLPEDIRNSTISPMAAKIKSNQRMDVKVFCKL